MRIERPDLAAVTPEQVTALHLVEVAALAEDEPHRAALTEIGVNRGSPRRAIQEDTAVVPAHRSRGLGLW